jgi:CBS domain-containing membrane protein
MRGPRLKMPRPWRPHSVLDTLRAGLGAALGLAFTGLLARLILTGHVSAEPLLIVPIGASAVLVFAVPASPLAQPRSVIGGNLVSGLVGVTAALLLPGPLLAGAVGAGLAVAAMSLTRTLHPPGGAIALGAALAGADAGLATYGQALAPIAACSILLTLGAAIFVNLTGRTYPHRAPAPASPHATGDATPADRVGFTSADLDAALAQYGELLDVSREDLDALFRQVELQAHRRIHSQIRCGDIMSRDVIAVDLEQTAESALAFLQAHDLRTAPVIDARRRVVGLVRRAELLAGGDRPVSRVLDPFVHKVAPGAAIETLLPLLSSGATHEAMVVDADRVLVGVITQTDLLAVLYRAHVVEAVVAGGRKGSSTPAPAPAGG